MSTNNDDKLLEQFSFPYYKPKSENHMTQVIKKKYSIVRELCYPVSNQIMD